MYETGRHRLLAWSDFLQRAGIHVLMAAAVVVVAVGGGTVGYHLTAGLGWLDSFLNASMILSGMGPVDHLDAPGAKLFAALYALFSGLIFIAIVGLIAAPWLHRLFHWMRIDDQ